MICNCSILLTDNRKLSNITLDGPDHVQHLQLANDACFKFLSIVETTRIPLYLTVGLPLLVSTSCPNTEHWFRELFCSATAENHEHRAQWWESAKQDSPLGVLVAVQSLNEASESLSPRVTELLIYASSDNIVEGGLPTPCPSSPSLEHSGANEVRSQTTLTVHAIALSSDLLDRAQTTTPPDSPVADKSELGGTFLPPLFAIDSEPINEPPIRKRKSATDAFDEASERRKKARRKGGEGVSAAAATKTDSQSSSIGHRRGGSNSQFAPIPAGKLSRSPSITSSRPPTAVSAGIRPSTLSRVQSISSIPVGSETEARNKDVISRIVMAGMRLSGLSQSKSRKTRATSAELSPVDATFDEVEVNRQNDEEFKLIYHQVFKGACFAFRASITRQSLQSSSAAIGDVVDRLLTIFCSDPLTRNPRDTVESTTPSGREVFRSSIP